MHSIGQRLRLNRLRSIMSGLSRPLQNLFKLNRVQSSRIHATRGHKPEDTIVRTQTTGPHLETGDSTILIIFFFHHCCFYFDPVVEFSAVCIARTPDTRHTRGLRDGRCKSGWQRTATRTTSVSVGQKMST